MSKPLKESIAVLIVDDEPAARRGLAKLLQSCPEAVIVGECGNGLEAVDAVGRLKPDLVFLDIQMPDLDGFGVVKRIGPDRMPPVIFVTAYDSYALQAFDIHALDYLLKPVDEHRFRRAYDRAAEIIEHEKASKLSERLGSLLEHVELRERRAIERIFIRETGHIHFVNVRDIVRLEAAGNYVLVHSTSARHLHRQTLSSLERALDKGGFIRISRSMIVNVNFLKALKPFPRGAYEIVMVDGSVHKSSRHYRKNIDKLIGKTE